MLLLEQCSWCDNVLHICGSTM